MLKSIDRSENITKIQQIMRASLRGFRKCTSCGFINGQRAVICRNNKCDLRIIQLAAINPFDPIQLITHGHIKMYSLRSKEKLLQRNFVKITEIPEVASSQLRAVCFVDKCESAHIVCHHIKTCSLLTNVLQAESYPIDESILWNLNIPIEQKKHLRYLYQLEEKQVPAVQKINSSMFVVKCMESKSFPAGRLHVTVFSNKCSNKSGSFSCSCKKLKIVLESDHSVSMKPEVCDHLLLLAAAILNKPEGKSLYGKFLDSLKYLWMPTSLDTPIVNCVSSEPSGYINYDLSLVNCNKPSAEIESGSMTDNRNDIFSFTEELFVENNIPDFCDIISKVDFDKVCPTQNLTEPQKNFKQGSCIKDPKLNTISNIISDEYMELNILQLNSLPSTTAPLQTPTDSVQNSLSAIEPFQQDHNLPVSNEIEKYHLDSLSNLDSQVTKTIPISSSSTNQQKSLLKTSAYTRKNTQEVLKDKCTIINPTNATTMLLDTKPTVVKQVPIKIVKIANPIINVATKQKYQILQLSKVDIENVAASKLNQSVDSVNQMENNSHTLETKALLSKSLGNKQVHSMQMSLSMSYESWLCYVIEILNESITIKVCPTTKRIFHVPNSIFNHFSKTFILDRKKRLLIYNSDATKNEKLKHRITYSWHFNQASTVQRIFAIQNLQIQLERLYQRLADGTYELYTPAGTELTDNNICRPIYPKIHTCKAFVQFKNNCDPCVDNALAHKCGFKVEWLPSAFPKSNFGVMIIEFFVGVTESFETM